MQSFGGCPGSLRCVQTVPKKVAADTCCDHEAFPVSLVQGSHCCLGPRFNVGMVGVCDKGWQIPEFGMSSQDLQLRYW